MNDPYFGKAPRRPTLNITTGAVYAVCATACCCAFLAFASVQPDAALKVGFGAAFTGGVLVISYGAWRLMTHTL